MTMRKHSTSLLAIAVLLLIDHAHAQTVAHRGVFAIQGQEVAENTISAVKKAYDKGYRTVELDIRATSDGTAVLMHDNCPSSPSTGCFGPGRTTNDDGQGGNYRPLFAMKGGLFGQHDAPTPQGRTYAQMVANYKYSKVYDQLGDLAYTTTEPGVAHGWELADLLWYKQSSSDSDAYKVRNMTLVLDIQSPQALAAAQAAVGQYNAWTSVVFKCWTTALSVDANGNLAKTYYGNFAFSYNPYTLQPASGNSSIASVEVTFPSGLGWLSYSQYLSALWTLQRHASISTNETFIAANGKTNNQDTLVTNLFNGDRSNYQYGVVRYPDYTVNGNGYFANTDKLTLANPTVTSVQQSFGLKHQKPITDILK